MSSLFDNKKHCHMHTLFISDIHLSETQPGITRVFLTFLKTKACHAEAIYILGDLFDYWIGDDDSSEFTQTIFNALFAITQQGIPIYFMPGNRDFLIGRRFLKATGCQKLKDPAIIQLYNSRTHIGHNF